MAAPPLSPIDPVRVFCLTAAFPPAARFRPGRPLAEVPSHAFRRFARPTPDPVREPEGQLELSDPDDLRARPHQEPSAGLPEPRPEAAAVGPRSRPGRSALGAGERTRGV